MRRGFLRLSRRGRHRAGILQRYRDERRRKKVRDAAYYLAHAGKFEQAAQTYANLAAQELTDNPFIYEMYAQYAFQMWIKAKRVDKALQQAREVLRVLSDGNILDTSTEDLSQMVGELYVAGYTAEAEAFSKEVNTQLAAHGLKPNPTPDEAGAAHPTKIPVVCPNCGAALPRADGADEVQCDYCGSTIRAGR